MRIMCKQHNKPLTGQPQIKPIIADTHLPGHWWVDVSPMSCPDGKKACYQAWWVFMLEV